MFLDLQIYKQTILVAKRGWWASLIYQLWTKGLTVFLLSLGTGILYRLWGSAGGTNYDIVDAFLDWRSFLLVPILILLLLAVFFVEHIGLLLLSVSHYKGKKMKILAVWKDVLICFFPLVRVLFVKGLLLSAVVSVALWIAFVANIHVENIVLLKLIWGGLILGVLLVLLPFYLQWIFTSYTVCVERVFKVEHVLLKANVLEKKIIRSLGGHLFLFYGVLFLLYIGLTAFLFFLLQGVIWLGVALEFVSVVIGFGGGFFIVLLFVLPLLLPLLYQGFHTVLYYTFMRPERFRPWRNVRKKWFHAHHVLWGGICIVLGYLLLGTILSFYVSKQLQDIDTHEVEVIAHRGDTQRAIQNTWSALESAQLAGIRKIEIDVQQTSDGALVLFHDEETSVLTGVAGTIHEKTLKEIQSLRIYGEEPLPLLTEVLEWAENTNTALLLDIKPLGDREIFAQSLSDVLKTVDTTRLEVMSFDETFLSLMREQGTSVPLGIVIVLKTGSILEYDVDFYSMNAVLAKRSFIKAIQEEGRWVYGWQLNGTISEGKAFFKGFDGVIVDDPVYTKIWFENYKEWSISQKIDHQLRFWLKQIRL